MNKTLSTSPFTIYCRLLLFAILLLCGTAYAQTPQPFGFENGSVGAWVGYSSSESVTANSNSTYVRTGGYSLKMSTTSNSSNRQWYTTLPYDTATNGETTFFIYWAKTDVAGTTADASLRHETSLPLTSSTSSDNASGGVTLSTTGWTRVTNAVSYTSSSLRYFLPAPRKTSSGNTASIYIDDGVFYSSATLTTVDTIKPYTPANLTAVANGNLVSLIWNTNVDDPNGTGVQTTLLLRNSNTSATAPVLNDQAMYSAAGGVTGPNTVSGGWQIISSSLGANDSTYLDVVSTPGNYIYAVVLCDMAYNYSLAAISSSVTTAAPAPTIFVNQSGFANNMGAIIAGGTSFSSNYSVTGYNLTSNISVTAPAGFQVSLDGNTFSQSISITPSGGVVASTPVYVHYTPTVANGSTGTLNIVNTSTGANTVNVPVSGTAITTSPTTPGTISFGAVTGSSIVVNLPTVGNGGRRIIVIGPNAPAAFTPVNGTAVSGVNANYSLAANQGGGAAVVYDGTGSGNNVVTVTGLNQATPYYFNVYEYNVNVNNSQNYLLTPAATGHISTITIAPTISVDATGFNSNFGNAAVGSNSAQQQFNVSGIYLNTDITITPPAGFAVSTTSGGPYSSAPLTLTQTSGTVPLTTIYAVMQPITATGATGTQNITLTSTGAPSQNVAVNGNALAMEPTTVGTITFGTVTLSSIVVNLPTVGNGTNRIIVANLGSQPGFVPADGTAVTGVNANYTAAPIQTGGGVIVYNGTGSGNNVVTVTNLDSGTLYYFTVYEYNVGTGTSENYFTTSPCNSDITTELTSDDGVKNVMGTVNVRLFPNPATDFVNILAPTSVNYVIHDMQGRALDKGAHMTRINTSSFAAGIYLITLTDDNGTVLKVDKLIKTQ